MGLLFDSWLATCQLGVVRVPLLRELTILMIRDAHAHLQAEHYR
jgi:hypothetical protein